MAGSSSPSPSFRSPVLSPFSGGCGVVRVSPTSALPFPHLSFLIHLLLALTLPLPRPLLLLLSRHLLLLILPCLPTLALPDFLLPLSGLLLVYQGGVWVLPFLLGFPPVRLMLRFLLLPMLPLGSPLMTLMPLLIPYRVLMIMMTPMTISLTLSTLLSTLHPPSLALDSSCSEYRRIVEYICGLFPQAVGVPPVDPPPRALFESFFAPAPHSQPPLAFNWFARVQQALVDADSRLAAWIAAGRSDHTFLPSCHSTYAVRGRMPLTMRFRLTSPCSLIMIVPYALPCKWALLFATSCCWSIPSARSQNRCPTRCGCCLVSWGSSAYKASLLPIPHYSINLSRLCQRVWLIRHMLPPPIPRTPAINVGSFTYPIFPPTSLSLRSTPSCRLRQYLRIPFSVRKTLASCWIRLVRLHPSGPIKLW